VVGQAAEQIIAGVVLSERLAVTMYGAIHRAQFSGQRNLRGLVIDPKLLAESGFRLALTDGGAVATAVALDHTSIVPTVAVESGGPDVVIVTRGVGRYVTVQDLITAARANRGQGGKLPIPVTKHSSFFMSHQHNTNHLVWPGKGHHVHTLQPEVLKQLQIIGAIGEHTRLTVSDNSDDRSRRFKGFCDFDPILSQRQREFTSGANEEQSRHIGSQDAGQLIQHFLRHTLEIERSGERARSLNQHGHCLGAGLGIIVQARIGNGDSNLIRKSIHQVQFTLAELM